MSTGTRRAAYCARSQLLHPNLRSTKAVSALPVSLQQTQLRWKTSSRPVASDVPSEKATGARKKSDEDSKDSKAAMSEVKAARKGIRTSSKDLRILGKELQRIHLHRRNLDSALQGPYVVRTKALDQSGSAAVVTVADGKVAIRERQFPNIWLRDNCQCSSCVHQATKQRLLDTFSIPPDIAIKEGKLENEIVSIEWSDGHKSEFSLSFLRQAALPAEHRAYIRQGLSDVSLWDSSIASSPPKVTNDPTESIHPMLQNLRKYGFCYVDDTPFDTPGPTEELLRRISFIRETHYGAFYDFTADLASKDTAYTNIALEAHTDTTYFSDPAGLQAFHLLSHSGGKGGASLLVDGFKVAADLKQQDSHAYETLARVNVRAHASGNEGISIQPYRGFPVLEHDPATGELLRVRWNTADRAALELPVEDTAAWYDAARKFDALLKTKANEYWEQLTPGRVLIFDNWRVLHGRSAFTGKRRICGGYVNRDDWISRFKMEEYGSVKVLGDLGSG